MPDRSPEQLRAEIARLEARLRDVESGNRQLTTEPYLRAVLEAVPVGVVLTDETGQIIHGNRWVEQMLRHPIFHSHDTESYGEWVSFHEDGRRVESHEYPLAKVIRDGADLSELDVHYQRGDASRFWMRIIGRPILDHKGERVGAAVALVDIDDERRLERQQELLIGELDHRVKNAFTVMKAIVRRSLAGADVDPGIKSSLFERLDAYAATHAKLVGSDWDTAPLAEIVDDSIRHFGRRRIKVGGPPLAIPARAALSVSMALYELGTNAVKHGALSEADGEIAISWDRVAGSGGQLLQLSWTETGGPVVAEPSRSGFGTFVVTQAVASETDGEVEMKFEPTGLVWKLKMPVND